MTSASQHIRARQMLSNIDAARGQKAHNENLRNILLDAEDTLQQLFSLLFSSKLEANINGVLTSANNNLKSYEENISYSHTCKRLPSQRYFEECGLILSESQLQTSATDSNVRAIELLRPLGMAHVSDDDCGFWERFNTLLTRCTRLVEAAKLDSSDWCSVVSKVKEVVQGVNLSRPVTKPLSAIDDQIRLLSQKNGDLRRSEKTAYESGEVAENETLMSQRITIMEGISDLITQKFHLIEQEKVQILGHHQQEIATAMQEVKEYSANYRNRVVDRKNAIQRDIHALESSSARSAQDNAIARSTYIAGREESDYFLRENTEKQSEVWGKIHELECELRRLAEQRREEVDRRVKLLEKEQLREMQVHNFNSFVDEHRALLIDASRMCEAQELLVEMLEEACIGSASVADQAVSSAASRMDSLEHATHDEHFKHFRDHYLLLGQLQFMKERMLDEYAQRAQVAQSLQELAMDSYNPKAREYALERQHIEDQIEGITAELEVLQRKADLYVEAFRPTEHALRHSSRPFLHPVQELAQINLERGRRIARYHALNIGGFGNPSNAKIDKSDAAVAVERSLVEEAKKGSVKRILYETSVL